MVVAYGVTMYEPTSVGFSTTAIRMSPAVVESVTRFVPWLSVATSVSWSVPVWTV